MLATTTQSPSSSATATSTALVDHFRALGRYDTKPDFAADCIRRVRAYLGSRAVDVWIEPSAGAGAFLNQRLQPQIGIDIDPKAPNIVCADFLRWQPPARSSGGLVVVIGSPPPGKNASDAVRFFNRAASFCDVIAFILPRTFEKSSIRRRLNERFHLQMQWVHNDAPFEHDGADVRVPAVLQIWERKDEPRIDPDEPTEHPDFTFVTDRREAHFALQRVGANAGRVWTAFADRSPSSNYFIRIERTARPVADILQSIDWSEVKARSAGSPSIAKTEIVRLYREWIEAATAAPPEIDVPQPLPDAVLACRDDRPIEDGVSPDIGIAIGPPKGCHTPDGARSSGKRAGGAGDRRRTRGSADRPGPQTRGGRAKGSGGGGRRHPTTVPAYPIDLTKVVITGGDLLTGPWLQGHLRSDPSYCFSAKVYPCGSGFGIGGGRISKLLLRFIGTRPNDVDEVNYERGWEGDYPDRHRAAIEDLCRAFPEPLPSQLAAHLEALDRVEIDRRPRGRRPDTQIWLA